MDQQDDRLTAAPDAETARGIERQVWERRATRELAAQQRTRTEFPIEDDYQWVNQPGQGGMSRARIVLLVAMLVVVVAVVAFAAGSAGVVYGTRQAYAAQATAARNAAPSARFTTNLLATQQAQQQERQQQLQQQQVQAELQKACEARGGTWRVFTGGCSK